MLGRNTGRTTRIANFAVDQLFTVGKVIVSDHIVFEGHKGLNNKHLELLIDKVRDKVERDSNGTLTISYRIDRLRNTDGYPVVLFEARSTKPKIEWVIIKDIECRPIS